MNVTANEAKTILSSRILEELERIGWTRYRLAQETGITEQTIGNICKGIHEPKASLVKTIADAMDVPMDSLFVPSKRRIRSSA